MLVGPFFLLAEEEVVNSFLLIPQVNNASV